MFTMNKGLAAIVLAAALLPGCGGGGGSTGGTGGTGAAGGGITCNTAHYTAGAVSVPTAGDMATYAKTYSGNTGTFNVGAFASDSGTAAFVLGASGSLTYNGTAQTVNSICKDNSLPMIYVEFGTTGAVDIFANGSFTGNLPNLTGVYGALPAGAATPTVSGFTPASGAVGTTVTISGANLGNFTFTPVVTFGTTWATVSSATATSIVVTVPANLTAGNSTITVSNSDGTGVVTVGTFNVTAAGGGVVTRLMGGAIQGTPLVLSTTVSTLVGPVTATPTSSPIMAPTGVTTDGTNLYVANSGTIYKVVIATGAVTTLASQPGAYGITTDGTNLYVTYFTFDLTTYTGTGGVSKIAISTGVVSPLAGAAAGYAEGTGSAALFNTPSGITTDGSNLYVADKGNNAIRKIVIATGQVTTLAGAGWQTFGSADGIGSAATFHFPRGVVTDGTNLYVADTYSEKIRKIVISSATVTTLAGSGTQAYTDGTGIAASFNWPTGITTDGTNLYVTSQNAGSHNVRKVVISSGVVTTIAGNAYAQATDGVGTAASFYNPNGITSDGTNLYVADFNNNKIRKIQ